MLKTKKEVAEDNSIDFLGNYYGTIMKTTFLYHFSCFGILSLSGQRCCLLIGEKPGCAIVC